MATVLRAGTRILGRSSAVSVGYERPSYQLAKRIFDFTVAAICLAFALPIILACALLVAIVDRAFPFHLQERIGRDGKRFKVIKIRTMVRHAEAILHSRQDLLSEYRQQYRLQSDPRVTPLGGCLRRAGLDELPLLLSVVLGYMSVVGPRPIVDREIEHFGDSSEHYLALKPGLIAIHRDRDYAARCDACARYRREASLATDIAYLTPTVHTFAS